MDERTVEQHTMDRGLALLPSSITIRVLDISVGGVLLQSPRPMKVGARGAFRTTIGGESFATEVAVAWVSVAAGGEGYSMGARFVGISPEQRQMIERFTS